ncbi:MAG: hypothetical protein ABIN13_05320, partial [Mucilaginibacter sp.]
MIKRFFWVLVLLLAVFFAGIYIYIPSTISANGSVVVITTERHTADFLTTYAGWKAWWPGEKSKDEKTYQYRGNTYQLTRLNNSGPSLVSVSNNTLINADITFIGVDKESTRVTWAGTLKTSSNPLKRIKQYEEIAELKKNLDALLQRLKQFLDDDKNVYHIGVKVQQVKDSVILTTNIILKQTPDVQQVYKLIAVLKQQVEQQHGVETGPPMLNVHQS